MINAYTVKCKQYAKRQRTFLQNQFKPDFCIKSVFDENYNMTNLQSFWTRKFYDIKL